MYQIWSPPKKNRSHLRDPWPIPMTSKWDHQTSATKEPILDQRHSHHSLVTQLEVLHPHGTRGCATCSRSLPYRAANGGLRDLQVIVNLDLLGLRWLEKNTSSSSKSRDTWKIIPGLVSVVIGSPPYLCQPWNGHAEGKQPYIILGEKTGQNICGHFFLLGEKVKRFTFGSSLEFIHRMIIGVEFHHQKGSARG